MRDRMIKGRKEMLEAGRILALPFALFLLLFLTSGKALAYSTEYTDPETGYEVVMDDEADLLSDSEQEALIEEMRPITAYGSAAFVSVDYNGSSTASFAREYYYAS